MYSRGDLYNFEQETGFVHALTFHGSPFPHISDGFIGKSISLNSASVEINGDFYSSCFVDPSLCKNGQSISFWLYPNSLSGNIGLFHSGNHHYGLDVVYHDTHSSLSQESKVWVIQRLGQNIHSYPIDVGVTGVVVGAWNHFAITVDSQMKSRVWVNFQEIDQNVVIISNPTTTPYEAKGQVVAGMAYDVANTQIGGFSGFVDECLVTDYAIDFYTVYCLFCEYSSCLDTH